MQEPAQAARRSAEGGKVLRLDAKLSHQCGTLDNDFLKCVVNLVARIAPTAAEPRSDVVKMTSSATLFLVYAQFYTSSGVGFGRSEEATESEKKSLHFFHLSFVVFASSSLLPFKNRPFFLFAHKIYFDDPMCVAALEHASCALMCIRACAAGALLCVTLLGPRVHFWSHKFGYGRAAGDSMKKKYCFLDFEMLGRQEPKSVIETQRGKI